MYEWRVNQIPLSMIERVLNHMERQGFEVQSIIPIDNRGEEKSEREVVLAGKKLTYSAVNSRFAGAPAVTEANLDAIYGRDAPEQQNS